LWFVISAGQEKHRGFEIPLRVTRGDKGADRVVIDDSHRVILSVNWILGYYLEVNSLW
jgi:hypothetical protein